MSAPARWRKPKCHTAKAAYRTQGDALRHLNRLARQNAQAVAPLPFELRGAYHCRCGAWHLTKSEQAEPVGAVTVGKRARPKGRKRSRSAGQRHLSVAPEVLAAPPQRPEPEPPKAYAPSDPITRARRARWAALQAEQVREHLKNPYPWPSASRRSQAA